MTDEFCPCDLVTLDAFELLGDAEHEALQGYLAECPELEAELADLREAVAAIPYSAPAVPLSPSLKGRLFARINAESAEPEDAAIATSQGRAAPGWLQDSAELVKSPLDQVKSAFQIASILLRQATSGDRLSVRSQDLAWQPHRVTGVSLAILHLDLANRAATALVRAEPGVQYPLHRHSGDEEIYMLEGDLIIDEARYGPGDYIRSKSTSTHAPSSMGGCMFFVRASLDNEYFDQLVLPN